MAEDVVRLNVGGQTFETTRSTLLTGNHPFFANLLSKEKWQDPNQALFIDRDYKPFRHVLNFLRRGHAPSALRDAFEWEELLEEARFYGIDPLVSAAQRKLSEYKDVERDCRLARNFEQSLDASTAPTSPLSTTLLHQVTLPAGTTAGATGGRWYTPSRCWQQQQPQQQQQQHPGNTGASVCSNPQPAAATTTANQAQPHTSSFRRLSSFPNHHASQQERSAAKWREAPNLSLARLSPEELDFTLCRAVMMNDDLSPDEQGALTGRLSLPPDYDAGPLVIGDPQTEDF